MPFIKKLDESEWALLEVLSDPIWCGEFLRSTAEGEVDKNLWPERKFKYRDYQKQVLTDKTEFIVYTGGRAIGKCQPEAALVYTTEGYQRISKLKKKPYFTVYCLDKDNNLVKRRALCRKDSKAPAYTIITETGYHVTATENHPILTPRGYKLIADLSSGDEIAIATKLPWDSQEETLQWHELRYIGYFLLYPGLISVSAPIKPRYKKIEKELEIIAKRFISDWRKDEFDNFYFHRRPGPFQHNIRTLWQQSEVSLTNRPQITKIPQIVKNECLSNIGVFIEAVYGQYGSISLQEITLDVKQKQLAVDFQELLLRFGIESKIVENFDSFTVLLLDYRAIYRFLTTFKIPGIAVGSIPISPKSNDFNEHVRFVKITKKYKSQELIDTYAIHVYDFNNYISNNIYVHNSIILQDKIVHEFINCGTEFPADGMKEVFVTPNQNQLTPFLNDLLPRLQGGRLLKEYFKNRINRTEGTMKFEVGKREFNFLFRIAGQKEEANMIGLHVPKIKGDEAQLFPLGSYTYLKPAYNSWMNPRQQIWAGVPNGLRNTTLYLLDQKTPKYKKYRVPAPNNPFYSYSNYIDDLKEHGGEQSDGFQQQVIGRHGSASLQVITRDDITTETFPFTNNTYTSSHKLKGIPYTTILERPKIPEFSQAILAVDPAYSDSCIIQLLVKDKHGVWRCILRYRLKRIDFVEQEQIIDWLATYYSIPKVVIDIGAGGNGAAIVHGLMHRQDYKGKHYDKRVIGVHFNENIITGYDDKGTELKIDAKSYAAEELVRLIVDGFLVFSEIDQEGLSEIERISKKRSINGKNTYYILSEKGSGESREDHIFASFICFVLGIKGTVEYNSRKKIGKPITTRL